MRDTKRILVIEDDPTMNEMIAFNLERAGYVVLRASAGDEGLRLIQSQPVDLALVDVMLPEIGGLDLCREIRRHRPTTPVIMVTALSGEADRLEGFSVGADDYVTKPFSMEELLARIRANLRRTRSAAAEPSLDLLVFGDLKIDLSSHIVTVADQEVPLRAKEFQLLSLFASSPGKVHSRPEISDKVWGYDFIGDTRTIDVHIKNLRRRLGAHSEFTFIETVRGAGYRFRVAPKSGR